MDNFGYKIIECADSSIHPLVYNSALKSLRRTPPFNLVRDTIFFARLHDLFEHWLERGRLLLAVSLDSTDVVYGWALTCGDVLCYVYVKQLQRGFGMATDLATEAIKGMGDRVQYQLSTDAFDRFVDHLRQCVSEEIVYSVPRKLRDKRVDKSRALDQPVKSENFINGLQGQEKAEEAKEVA